MWFLTIIFWVLFLAGLFLILIALLDKDSDTSTAINASGESAMSILQKRYARGEIDDDTFKRMKSELGG